MSGSSRLEPESRAEHRRLPGVAVRHATAISLADARIHCRQFHPLQDVFGERLLAAMKDGTRRLISTPHTAHRAPDAREVSELLAILEQAPFDDDLLFVIGERVADRMDWVFTMNLSSLIIGATCPLGTEERADYRSDRGASPRKWRICHQTHDSRRYRLPPTPRRRFHRREERTGCRARSAIVLSRGTIGSKGRFGPKPLQRIFWSDG